MTTDGRGDRLAGKVALVTGGARGMGESFARAIVAQGGQVVITDVLDAEGAAVAADLGEACTYLHLDVTDRQQWADAVSTTVGTFGRLNVLVNNAGIVNFGPIDRFTGEQWDTIIAVNLTGVFNGISAAVEALKLGAPSSIINISSTAGLHGYASLSAYNASKFGVRGLTKSVALDLAQYDIRCNSVHPGGVTTPMTAGMQGAPRHVAMHRMGRPEELAQLVVFLASDESSFSTGAEFVADGGETAGLAAGMLGI
ncbi:MAG: SDR family oxidoreductase [Ilumatobacteraceae bacterium]|jgi:3alpha(or 20beta)-hydroxysteroid dehydrogenase